MILPRSVLPNNPEQVPPFRMQRIGCDFNTRPEVPQARRKTFVEAGAVFAEAVHAGAGEDQTGPAAEVFDFFVAAPDGPVMWLCQMVNRRVGWGHAHSVSEIFFFPV
jgi:hypothetical protein